MSRYYSAAQYEQDYLPKRLGNWQVNPSLNSKYGTAGNKYATLQGPSKSASIQFLVDDRGHFKPGVKKISNSFRIKPDNPADSQGATRWPKPSLSIRAAPAATMGHKPSKACCETGKPTYDGIILTRLPRPCNSGAAAPARPVQAC